MKVYDNIKEMKDDLSNNNRYKIIKGSESGHCCFEATIIDVEKEDENICECFEIEDAVKIAGALNVL